MRSVVACVFEQLFDNNKYPCIAKVICDKCISQVVAGSEFCIVKLTSL